MRLTNTRDLERSFRSAFAPPPATTIDEWAERFRYLPSETAADAGMWRNSKTPWLVEPMRELSPSSRTQIVVMMTSARIGKTETLNNFVGFYMDMVKCPIMVVQPIEDDAEEWSKDHLDPMIANTPSLSALVTPDKDRRKGNTIRHKKYKGGILYAAGANSGKTFRRKTIRAGAGDEVDGWPGTIDGEGDPWWLFLTRGTNYQFSRRFLAASTPTIKGGSRIETLFLEGDQRYYHVPCPECGHYQRLVFSALVYDPHILDADGRPVTDYACASCGVLIPEWRRDGMVARGRWVASFPGRPVASFQISQLYSPWVRWSEMAAAYLAALHDPLQMQVFINTKLGETYDVTQADAWDPDSLMRLRVPLEALPPRAVLLTAASDTQADRLVLQVDAWGPGEERWTVDRQDIHGDPSKDPSDPTSPWAELDRLLLTLRYRTADGRALAIRACGVDTGGHATAQAYRFCRSRRRRCVWAIKGDKGSEGSPLWPKTPSRKNKGNLPLHLVGIFAGKAACMARLKAAAQAIARGERGGPGFWHFAAIPSLAESYFDELTSEACVVDTARARGGRATSEIKRRWQLRRSDLRNEGLDCSVYSYAVLHGLLATGVRLDRGVADAGVVERVSARQTDIIKRAETPPERPSTVRVADPAPVARPPAPVAPKPRRPRWQP